MDDSDLGESDDQFPYIPKAIWLNTDFTQFWISYIEKMNLRKYVLQLLVYCKDNRKDCEKYFYEKCDPAQRKGVKRLNKVSGK